MTIITPEQKKDLGKGRMVCPNCQKKGMGYAGHRHAFGEKDYDRTQCRYCRKTYKITRKEKTGDGQRTEHNDEAGDRVHKKA